MSSENIRLAKHRKQYIPNEPLPSVRIRAVAVLICASSTPEGRTVCGELSRYEHDEPEGALDLARRDGWTFRGRSARCKRCGSRGASFGK